MYVCICHAVTDGDIRKAVDLGASSLFDVQSQLPVGAGCGRCQDAAQSVVRECLASRPAVRRPGFVVEQVAV